MTENSDKNELEPEDIVESIEEDLDEETSEALDQISEQLGEIKQDLQQRADTVRLELVRQLENAAESIRKEVNERDLPEDSLQQVERLTEGIDRTARYLEDHSLDEIGQDATETVRRNIWGSLAVVFVVGVIIGIVFRRK